MKAGSIDAQRRTWRMPLYAALVALLVFLPSLISSNNDALYLFFVVPCLALVSICVLIFAAIRRDLLIAIAVVTFCAVSAVAFLYNYQIRTFARWTVWSREYKEQVLAEPTSASGDLKHIEWDGWGWGGQDFSLFLVFDPADSLSGPDARSGKVKGIPCEVSYVRRMDTHWYVVYFDAYVDQSSWDRCK
jgi:cell division protein FtsW (lipid II flippase)